MQSREMSLWKGCIFPDNIIEEQDWEAVVGHFLLSAKAATDLMG